jgi:carbonic anhydrase/acetyltransferase-like protein (isoleucine patch superfamily)
MSGTVHIAPPSGCSPLGVALPVLSYAIAGKPLYLHVLERWAQRVNGPLRIAATATVTAIPGFAAAAGRYGRVETVATAPATRFPLARGGEVELTHVWHVHDAVADILAEMKRYVAPDSQVESDVQIEGNVHIESGARVLGGARLKGNVYVGRGSLVGNGALVRGNTHLGDKAMIGFVAEIKSSILLQNVIVGPSSAVPDCLLEDGVFLGGLVRISNTQFDFPHLSAMVDGKLVGTGRAHLGASIAAQARIAGGVRISPTRTIGHHSEVLAGVVVVRNVPARTRVRLEQQLTVEAMPQVAE